MVNNNLALNKQAEINKDEIIAEITNAMQGILCVCVCVRVSMCVCECVNVSSLSFVVKPRYT